MPFLLDTNVVSETVRARPEPHVLEWIERQAPPELYLASQTIGYLDLPVFSGSRGGVEHVGATILSFGR